jgi:hypothetical protein
MCRWNRTAPDRKRTSTTGRPDGTVTVASCAATPSASVETTPHGRLPAGNVVVVTTGNGTVVVVVVVGSAWGRGDGGGDVQAAATMLRKATAAATQFLGTDRRVTRSAYGGLEQVCGQPL